MGFLAYQIWSNFINITHHNIKSLSYYRPEGYSRQKGLFRWNFSSFGIISHWLRLWVTCLRGCRLSSWGKSGSSWFSEVFSLVLYFILRVLVVLSKTISDWFLRFFIVLGFIVLSFDNFLPFYYFYFAVFLFRTWAIYFFLYD